MKEKKGQWANITEQGAEINEQRAKSNEQHYNNEQKVTSNKQKVTSNEHQAKNSASKLLFKSVHAFEHNMWFPCITKLECQ